MDLNKSDVKTIPLTPTTPDAAGDQKRRSSSRSIKRKRFDDEIVEYSLGVPPAQVNRVVRSRTQSQTIANTTNLTIGQPTPPVQSPAYTFPEPPTPTTSTAVPSPINEIPLIDANGSGPSPSPTLSAASPMHIAAPLTPDTPQPVLAKVTGGTGKAGKANAKQASHTTKTVPTTANERRRNVKSITGNKKNKKSRTSQQMLTKDLGRWKPIDDLSLIVGIQQTNDLRVVHQGVKFSCKFTIQEMQSRWYSLLYDETISRVAVAAMRNLHPELVEAVHSKALYTTHEEELLGTIKSTDTPTLDKFQELLHKNATIFHTARTPKALFNHWNSLKQYMLLPDQQIIPNTSSFYQLPDGDCNIHFSDQEEKINDQELSEARDEALELELALADRKCKKEIRHLENELPKWTVLVDSITGIGIHPEFDNSTLAVLRGRLVRYLMRSREITLGRKSDHESVDVDLSLEGPACKVSRRQGTIKLRSNGDFFIANEGKRALFIDGIPLLQGNKTKLNNNCTVEIAGLRVVFMINVELINAIRQESAKMNGALN